MKPKTYPPILQKQTGLLHGGDYNPEQWPESVWTEDSRLMKLAKVNSLSVGIFSWVSLDPSEGQYTFDWLDRVMDMQASEGRSVCLATPTAAVPAWLSAKYPEVLRTGADGVRKRHGNRVNTCWSSPVFREKAREIGEQLAHRYKNHPALGAWHISNEYGGYCYCELCAQKFREWLQVRYQTLDKLNECYWTKFWSHTYTDWDQIEIPGDPHGETSVLGLTLDWKRFTSHQIVDFYLHEKQGLKAITPDTPCTTNLMGTYDVINGFEIAPHLDFVSWDSYPWFRGRSNDPSGWAWTSFVHDLNRSLKQGQPFLLMECSPSASNWYKVMQVKRPGQHVLEGLQAIAHGSEGVQYFQWRQSRGSLEQFHGAVVSHNNREEAKVFQDVCALGEKLERLGEVVGASVPAKIAVIFDWEISWGVQVGLGYRSAAPDYSGTVFEHYRALFSQNLEADVVDSCADLAGYKLVVAPMLYLLRPGVAERLAAFVEGGGTLVVSYLTGWVDESGLAYQGGFPEPLASVLGLWSEELDELYPDEENHLVWKGERYDVRTFCERIHPTTAETLAVYGEQFYAGEPCLTVNRYGAGEAYYVASRNDHEFLKDFLGGLAKQLGIEAPLHTEQVEGVSIRRRVGQDKEFVFVLNYTTSAVEVNLGEQGLVGLDGNPLIGAIHLPAFGVEVFVRSLAGHPAGVT